MDLSEKIADDWEDQCQKLQVAGYSTEDFPPELTGHEKFLLERSYQIDPDQGADHLRRIALMRFSDADLARAETYNAIESEIFDSRDKRLEELQRRARLTFGKNFGLLESGAKNPILDQTPLYKWMGVSRRFMSKNRLKDSDKQGGSIGTTPSLKTLYQISAPLGIHPLLFLADKSCRRAVVQLVNPEQRMASEVEQARETLDQLEQANDQLDEAPTEPARIDAIGRIFRILRRFAQKVDCDSPGGKFAAILGSQGDDPDELVAMTHFGHKLGNIAPEWLHIIDVFEGTGFTPFGDRR